MNPDKDSTEHEFDNEENPTFDFLNEESLINDEEPNTQPSQQDGNAEDTLRSVFNHQEDSPDVLQLKPKNPIQRFIKSIRGFLFSDTEDIGRQSSPAINSVEDLDHTLIETSIIDAEEEDESTLERLSDSVQIPVGESSVENDSDFWNTKRKTGQLHPENQAEDDSLFPEINMRKILTGELPDVEDLPSPPISKEPAPPAKPASKSRRKKTSKENDQNDELRQFLAQLDDESLPTDSSPEVPYTGWGQSTPPASEPFKLPSQPEEELDDLLFGTALRFGTSPGIPQRQDEVDEDQNDSVKSPYFIDDLPEDSSVFLSDADLTNQDEEDIVEELPSDRFANLRSNMFLQPDTPDEEDNPYDFFPGELSAHPPVFTFNDEEKYSPVSQSDEEETYRPPFSDQDDSDDDFFESIRKRALFDDDTVDQSPFRGFVVDESQEESESNIFNEELSFPQVYETDFTEGEGEARDFNFLNGNIDSDFSGENQTITGFLDDLAANDREDSPPPEIEVARVEEIKGKSFLQRFDLNSKEFLIITASLVGIVVIAVATILLTRNIGRINLPAINLPAINSTNDVYPVGMKMPGGWYFDIQKSFMDNGQWKPQAAEWLEGSYVRRVIAIPWNEQSEAVVRTFSKDDKIQLYMSNEDIFAYRVTEVKQVPQDDTNILNSVKPSLVIILYQPKSEMRWVVIAEQ
jgi:hypothetical protein